MVECLNGTIQSMVLLGALPEKTAGWCSSPHHRAAFWPTNHAQTFTREAENIVTIVVLLNVGKETIILAWKQGAAAFWCCSLSIQNEWAQSWDKNTWNHMCDTTVHIWRKTSSYQFLFGQSILPPHKAASHFPAIRTFPDTGTVPSFHTCLHFTQNNVFILACCYSCCFPCSGLAVDVWDNRIPKTMHSSVSSNLLYAFQFIHKCNEGNERRTSKVKVEVRIKPGE